MTNLRNAPASDDHAVNRTPRDTAYDGTENAAHVLVNRTGALVYNIGRFLEDCVENLQTGRRFEAEGSAWVVPNELRESDGGADAYVTADGTVTPRPVGAGQNAWKTARKRGDIRPAHYAWIVEGVDIEAVRSTMNKARTLQAVAGRLVRETILTGRDTTRELHIIEGELRFMVAELMTQDPTMRDTVRSSYPAYIFDRIERMSTDGAGWHWGDGSRYESSHEAHAVAA